MGWYLMKTWVGKEEELIKEIRREVPAYLYQECFIIRQERIWRKQQKSIIHTEPLFPGCVFLTCKNHENQKSLVSRMEQIPAIARLISCGCLTFFPMMEEDAQFLEKISGQEHMVKLSYVFKNEQGNICTLSEPLKLCQGQIERMQFKKRYAMVRHRLWGEERVMVLGIVLKEDIPVKESLTEDIPVKESLAKDILMKESLAKDIPVKENLTEDILVKEDLIDNLMDNFPVKDSLMDNFPVKEMA